MNKGIYGGKSLVIIYLHIPATVMGALIVLASVAASKEVRMRPTEQLKKLILVKSGFI